MSSSSHLHQAWCVVAGLRRLYKALVYKVFPCCLWLQVHNWATNLDDPASSSFEFVAPSALYAVINGKEVELDLNKVGGDPLN